MEEYKRALYDFSAAIHAESNNKQDAYLVKDNS